MSNADMYQQPFQVWSLRLIAGMHFIRLVFLIAVVSVQLYTFVYLSSSVDPLLLVGFTPVVIIELLFGFLFVLRKTVVIYPAILYTGFVFVLTLSTAIMSSNKAFPFVLFCTALVELLLIAFLGLMWIKREWVRSPTYSTD